MSRIATRPESTDVRFTIRTLLAVTATVALLAAIVAPYVRGLAPEEQLRALTACSTWLAMVAGWIFVAARRRLAVERLAGQPILRLPIYDIDYRWRRISLYPLSMSFALYGLVCIYFVVE